MVWLSTPRCAFIPKWRVGQNPDLGGLIEEADYYQNVIQSRDYIYAKWSRYFEVIDIIDALAEKDLVVLRQP